MKKQDTKDIHRFIEMVKDAKVCMLITSEKTTDKISGRPMGINKIDDDGTMWFFTKKTSHKVDELQRCKNVVLSITDHDNNNYLMVQGTSSLSEDKNKMEELWNPIMKAWFPLGLEDPDMVLLNFQPEEVNYWDSSSSKMVVLFNMIKSIITGDQYDEGEHGTLNLNK